MLRFFKACLKWATHPIVVFVTLQIVWVAVTVLWVVWFLNSANEIAGLAQRFGSEAVDSRVALTYLILGCVLLGVLLVGTVVLFIFGQRQSHFMALQRNFVSSVTHELRSPLASIQLNLETMVQRPVDAQTQEALLQGSLDESRRLRRLVEKILSAAHLDKRPFSQPEADINTSLDEVLDKVGQKLAWLDQHISERLTIACPRGLRVRGSETSVLMVILNLVENAIRYSNPKTPIRVEVTENSQDHLLVRVIDAGFGLERRERKRIFKMFYRTNAALKNVISGSGLGLFIVRETVKSLGGKIWVESPGVDKGSTFFVSLPKT